MNFRTLSDFTFKKSILQINDITKTLESLGLNSVSIVDKNNMHGAYKLYKDAKKHGLKYIPAIDIDVQMDNNERGNFIIIAKNEEGFNFIKKTVSLSFLKNHELFVDYDALLGNNDIFVLSGDKDSFLGKLILNKDIIEKEVEYNNILDEIKKLNDSIENSKSKAILTQYKKTITKELKNFLENIDKKSKGKKEKAQSLLFLNDAIFDENISSEENILYKIFLDIKNGAYGIDTKDNSFNDIDLLDLNIYKDYNLLSKAEEKIKEAIVNLKIIKLNKKNIFSEEQLSYLESNDVSDIEYYLKILNEKRLYTKNLINAKKESLPQKIDELIEKFQKDFNGNFFFEIIKGHYDKDGEYKKINETIYRLYKEGKIQNLIGNIPYLYKARADKTLYIVQRLMDESKTIDKKDSMDNGDFHIRNKEEFENEFRDFPGVTRGNKLIEDSCDFHLTDHGYLTPKILEDNPEVIEIYKNYSERWIVDDFKKMSLNEFSIKYSGYKGMFKRYELQFSENDLYYMISEQKFEEKTTEELQKMEEEELIEYAKNYQSERKRNIIKGLKKDIKKIIYLFDYEFLVIKQMGFIDYFLIVSDYINWAKNNNLPVGPGRGSAPGSLLSYLIGITDICPIKHKLLFTRFLNINRISYPDIDVDFSEKEKIIEYCRNKYGADHVAQICTFGTLASKSAFKDICKVYNIPYYLSNELAKLIPDDKDGGLVGAYETIEEFKEQIDSNATLREIYNHAVSILGNKKQLGIHACATIISPTPMYDHTIVQYAIDSKGKIKDEVITQYEGEDCEKIGLIKMDFLGLNTLNIEKNVIDDVKKYKNIDIDLLKVDKEDPEVLKNIFALGDTDGVFQFESHGMKKYLMELQPDCLDDLIAMNALYRPGPLQYIGGQEEDKEKGKEFKPSYIKRKNGTEPVEYPDKDLENALKDTYGLCVHGDTFISLSNGDNVKIRDMYENPKEYLGKEVVSFDIETGNVINNKINYLFNNGEKEFFNVRYGNHQFIKTTGDHKMYVYDSKKGKVVKKMTKDLNSNDFLLSLKNKVRKTTNNFNKINSCFNSSFFGEVRLNGLKEIFNNNAFFTEYDQNLLNNFNLFPVQEIVSIGKSTAYDMEVDNVHNYVADGVVVSNCVYQESLMQMVRDYAGFSMGDADVLRKAVGKKKLDLMEEQKNLFLKKSEERGKITEVSEKIWKDIVEPFGGYGFNKSHATCYAYIAFDTGYLKHYYKSFFFAHLLNENIDNDLEDVLSKYMENAIATGINISSPNINTNTPKFSYIDDSNIEFGMNLIKGVGLDIAEAIYKERIDNGSYESMVDFLNRLGKSVLTKKSLSALTMAGALDIFGIDRDILLFNIENEFFKENMEGKREFMLHIDEERNKRDLVREKLKKEKSVIGIILSEHVFSGYKTLFRKYTIGVENVVNKIDGGVKIFGLITEYKKRKTQSGDMAVLGIECPEFYINVTLFAKSLEKYEEQLDLFKTVAITGNFVNNKYGTNIYIDDMVILNTTEFLLKLEDEKKDTDLEKVYRNILILEKLKLKENKIVDISLMSRKEIEGLKKEIESRKYGYTNIVMKKGEMYAFSKYCITS